MKGKRLEIFVDELGRLALAQYDPKTGQKELSRVGDRAVELYIRSLSNSKVKQITTRSNAENKTEDLLVLFSDCGVVLRDTGKLAKYAKSLGAVLVPVKRGLENQSINVLSEEKKKANASRPAVTKKENGKEKKEESRKENSIDKKKSQQKRLSDKEEPSKNKPVESDLKVTRENKYVNQKIAVIITALVVFVVTAVAAYAPQIAELLGFKGEKGEEPDLPESSITSVEGETATPSSPVETTTPYTDVEEPSITPGEMDNTVQEVYEIVLDYEDLTDTPKAQFNRETYGDLISKYSKMYGLDPDLMMAISTQERDVHSDVMDKGGATGKMQLQNSVWVGATARAYNFETGKIDAVKVTKENIGVLDINIRVGCMYFANCLTYMNGNIPAAVQCYNFGYGNMEKVFKSYESESGKSKKEVLADVTDLGWLSHREVVEVGDPMYLEHVSQWLGNTKNITVQTREDGPISLVVTNQAKEKVMS